MKNASHILIACYSCQSANNSLLPGRSFDSWRDLNEQARAWCHRINQKEKRQLGSTSTAAYLAERPHLRSLPKHQPPIYQALVRLVDSGGYIIVDTNRYSVPDYLIGRRVEVHKTMDKIRVFFKEKVVAQHDRFLEKCRDSG